MLIQMSSPGNPSCWVRDRSWHRCCSAAAGCFQTGSAEESFEACCRRTFELQAPRAALVAQARLRPGLHPASISAHQAVHVPTGSFQCFGLTPDFFDEKPHLPSWPTPQRCPGGVDIFPIAIGIPDELIVPCIPFKKFDYALVWPGDRSTYSFNSRSREDTAAYHAHLRQAWFAVTRPKGGWDCLRHYEILAAGTVPYFVDLTRAPSRKIPFLPAHLLGMAKKLPGVYEGRLDPTAFQMRDYVETAAPLLRYTKHRLAASKLAEYLLSHLQMHRRTILFLLPPDGYHSGGYLSRNIFYGLQKVLGSASVVDYPFFSEMYAAHGRTDMSTTGLLGAPALRLNHTHVEHRLRAHEFGAVIYSNARAPLPFWDLVAARYTPKEVAFLDGFDHANGSNILKLAPHGRYFLREMEEACPTGPHSLKTDGNASAAEKGRRIFAVACFVFVEEAIAATGAGVVLPPMLLGMFGLFAVLLCLDSLGCGSAAELLFQFLAPGYRFLLKWAPVFFTPALVKLPLVEEPISAGELFRLSVLIACGGVLQMGFVGVVAKAIASQQPNEKLKDEVVNALPGMTPTNGREAYPRPGRPFKRRWLPVYAIIMLAALLCLKFGRASQTMEVCFMLCASLLSFVLGNSAPPALKTALHPIFAGVLGSWLAIALWASQDETRSFHDVLVTYASPTGAGPLMSRLLSPLVIALALLLFERRRLLQRDFALIIATSMLAAVFGLFGTAVIARILQLPKALAASTVSRYCTAPLALAVSSSLHSSAPLTVAVVVASGFLGIFVARPLLRWLEVDGSRERGLAIGAVSHVLGTVTLASWDEAAVPYCALCFVLSSGFAAALAAIPLVQASLLCILPS
ncbi:PLGG1 [Symbiodinium natans]|uniref:PLGG1 protein n=1 Tax=Symbiodinium natans TaxID=878477 RepID=A0A812KRZ1_9DINO|nr:PLGG1 [Symbiodinium natans]